MVLERPDPSTLDQPPNETEADNRMAVRSFSFHNTKV